MVEGKTEARADFWPRVLCIHHWVDDKCIRCLLPSNVTCSCGHTSTDHSQHGCTFLIGMRFYPDGAIAPMDSRKAHNCPCTGFEPRILEPGQIGFIGP